MASSDAIPDNSKIEWLRTSEAHTIIQAARDIDSDATAIVRFRSRFPDVDSGLIREAISQAKLCTKAEARWNQRVTFLLTPDGLEQATHPLISAIHAQSVISAFGTNAHVVDLSCGLGFDAAAFLKAGLRVTAIERDPTIALMAQHNLSHWSNNCQVICTEAENFEIPTDADVIFVDPARRDLSVGRDINGNARRVFDARKWSPSWPFIQDLARSYPVLAKVAPGISDQDIGNWDSTFISINGNLAEAMLKSPLWPSRNSRDGFESEPARHAAIVTQETTYTHDGPVQSPTATLGKFLIVPNPALVRARNLTVLTDSINGGLVHPMISWLSSDDTDATFASMRALPDHASYFEILTQTSANVRALKHEIAKYPHHGVTIMTRGVKLDVESLRKKIVGSTSRTADELVVAIYRGHDQSMALICRRLKNSAH